LIAVEELVYTGSRERSEGIGEGNTFV
jgi:hypothetical protein